MPGRLKVKVVAGRHLPVMDRASELTDAFVEVKFGSETYKTEVYPKCLNPIWNSEWFQFEVDDEHLQDEPLQIRVLDYDTYSSHDAIGKVYIDIDPLLAPDSANSLHGWFPIFDTMHGIRGEILLTVKIVLFADFNRFKKSSCGIKFICGTSIPQCYKILSVHGFVEELVVSEDPEYQWIDKLRTPRATNEARQRLFSQVSGELQRRIGMKVFEMGGNAVAGYHQHFDIEGEFGVVVRGIGTAVSIEAQLKPVTQPRPPSPSSSSSFSPPTSSPHSASPVKFLFPHRSSSLEFDPTANTSSAGQQQPRIIHNPLDLMEFPFFTLTSFPTHFLTRVGGVVAAYSVKLLDKIHNPDEPETRDAWWSELRQEIKSHSSVLGCNAVVGYKERTSICDELIVLSAQGTAAVVSWSYLSQGIGTEAFIAKEKIIHNGTLSAAVVLDTSHPLEKLDLRKRHHSGTSLGFTPPQSNLSFPLNPLLSNVNLFQVPYQGATPFPISLSASPLDPSVQVPEVLFTTIDIPPNVHITGKGTMIQARFCRSKKKGQGESNAITVGDILPFVQYELHKQLYNKLKLHGMNAIFLLEINISIGENIIVGVAAGTAVYVTALPQATNPVLHCQNVKQGSAKLALIEQRFASEIEKSKERFDLLPPALVKDFHISDQGLNSDMSLLNLSAENKQSLPVSVEDPEDEEQLLSMIDPLPPDQCYISNCQHVPGIAFLIKPLQTFSMFWRVRYRESASDRVLNRGLRATCNRAVSSIWYRLSRLSPYLCLCGFRFEIDVPEDDEIHILVTGSVIEYKSQSRGLLCVGNDVKTKDAKDGSANELQFFMEECKQDDYEKEGRALSDNGKLVESVSKILEDEKTAKSGEKHRVKTNRRLSGNSLNLRMPKQLIETSDGSAGASDTRSSLQDRSRHSTSGSGSSDMCSTGWVDIVTTPSVPGRRTQRHIGSVNMFIIRETSAVRGGEEGLPGTELSRGTGSNWFAHSVLAETQALLRAYVGALAGNALTSYQVQQCTLDESVAKNQAQCLIHVCGDAVVTVPQK